MSVKVLWAVNILTEVDGQAYPSHLIHAFRLGRDTDYEMVLFTPRRMSIAAARNSAVEYALTNDCDYVFFSDDDMELHPQTLKTLISRDKDIIMAMCYIRGFPYRPMVLKWVEQEDAVSRIADIKVDGKLITLWEDCEKFINSDGLIEPVAAVGCAATLVKINVFRKVSMPWFYTGTANTEDIYFCMKAQQSVENLTIAVDTTIPAGHVLKDKNVLYPYNANILRKFSTELKEINDGYTPQLGLR